MAKRSIPKATARGAAPRADKTRKPRTGPSVRGGPSAHSAPRDASGRPLAELLAGILDPATCFDRSHPLGRLGTLLLLQAFEWQSVVLDLHRQALRDSTFDEPVEDHLRTVARTAMGAYLEFVKSIPERRERLALAQSQIADALAEAIQELRQRLAELSE